MTLTARMILTRLNMLDEYAPWLEDRLTELRRAGFDLWRWPTQEEVAEAVQRGSVVDARYPRGMYGDIPVVLCIPWRVVAAELTVIVYNVGQRGAAAAFCQVAPGWKWTLSSLITGSSEFWW